MHIVAVSGKRFAREVLRDAIRAAKMRPIELLIENGDTFTTFRLDYSGTERYPTLERDSAKSDLLSRIIQPLAGKGNR
jgi:hypothetical protein